MSLRFLARTHSLIRLGLLCGALGTPALSGCSGGKEPWEATYPVSGVVTYKGSPVANADISFFPEDASFPDTVRPKAKSGTDGTFVISTYAGGDGAPAGNYKVTIVRHEVTVSKDTIVAKPNDLPGKYSKRDTTDLEVQVVASQNDLPPFDLR